jgi:Tfp pilus assembly protein PilN
VRDLEFLPDWYPQTRKRRRLVILQGWLILVLAGGMAAHLVLADRNIKVAEKSLGALQSQLDQTNAQLAEIDKLDAMRKQWRQQEQLLSRLGFYVEACKALDTLDALMPKQMSLTNCQLDNEEKIDVGSSGIQAAKGDQQIDRRLRVRVQGVCPTDVDLANFMTQLATIPFFEQVSITYAREKGENNHVMREFEVSFSLNLNSCGM